MSKYFKQDTMMFLEFNICMADYEGIPLEAFFNKHALLATATCKVVRRMLRTPYQRQIMERVIDDMGLEHLGHVRYIQQDTGAFVDMWADDADYEVTT